MSLSQPASSDLSKQLSPRLLRCAQAARYLGVSTKRIRQLILSGDLPYVQLQPGNSPFLLDVRDLDRFIEANKKH